MKAGIINQGVKHMKNFKIIYKKHGRLFYITTSAKNKKQAIINTMACSFINFLESDIIKVLKV